MSAMPNEHNNVDKHLLQHHEISPTKNDTNDNHEKWSYYKRLLKWAVISKEYIEDGMKIKLSFLKMEDADWDIILEKMSNKEQPLRELELRWRDDTEGPGFIKFTKNIEAHTTLAKLYISFSSISSNKYLTILLEALKNNRSIKYLWLDSGHIDLETARALKQTLMNNHTLFSLNISAFNYSNNDHTEHNPIDSKSVDELAHLLKTVVIERFSIHEIDNDGLKVLIKSLPMTLTHLDLSRNKFNKDSIPILQSYLKSNGILLEKLILDDNLVKEYFKEQKLSLSSTVKIISDASWQAKFLRRPDSLELEPHIMNDRDWCKLLMGIINGSIICREINLIISDRFDHNKNYFETLLSEHPQMKSLIITDKLLDSTIQIDLYRRLKRPNFITKLEICYNMKMIIFNEFLNLLTEKTNIISLKLSGDSNITDEEAIMLAHSLKTNSVLQNLELNQCQVGDIGFQALLSSLPDSLLQLTVENSLITAKSLRSLLMFIKSHTNLKKISLNKNGISSTSKEVNVTNLVEKILQIANINHCVCDLDINDRVQKQIAETTNDGNICLSNGQLRDDHILEFYNELKKKSNQTWSLDISYNQRISFIGYHYLALILSSNINIVRFSVSGNNMNNEARASLFNGLCSNKTLVKFDVGSNKLIKQDMEYIGRFIQNNSALKEIVLKKCEIDFDGIILLIKFLPTSSLEKLDLNCNSIDDRAFASLISNIPDSLITLSLDGNKITESSMQTIIDFLTANQTLKQLMISDNPIFENRRSDLCNNACWQQANRASNQNNICELK